jgi:hypothetical protein
MTAFVAGVEVEVEGIDLLGFANCTECDLPPDHFIHTCRFTDCRTPHDFCDYKPPADIWGIDILTPIC